MLTTLRQALRALRRSPGFTLAALATFTLGVGANATVFGVVNDIARHVLGGSLRRTAAGIALGLAGAAALTRFMAAQLYATSPLDPAVLAGGALVVALVAAAATWLPARRATRVNPTLALRAE